MKLYHYTGAASYTNEPNILVVSKANCDEHDSACSMIMHRFQMTQKNVGDKIIHTTTFVETREHKDGLISYKLPKFSPQDAANYILSMRLQTEFDIRKNTPFSEIRSGLETSDNTKCNTINVCHSSINYEGGTYNVKIWSSSSNGRGARVSANLPIDLVKGNILDTTQAVTSYKAQLGGRAARSTFNQASWQSTLVPGNMTKQGMIIEIKGTLANVQTCLESKNIAGAGKTCIRSSTNWLQKSALIPE